MIRARALLLSLLAVWAGNISSTWAAQLYVSPTGSDSNTGDAAHPWLTLQHAANVVNPGDTVNVLAGTYTGFYCSRSGDASDRITFLAQPGVIINKDETHFNRDGITAFGGSYITIDGFDVTGATRAGISSQNNTDVIVRNCTCDSNGTWGIFTGFSVNFDVENNVCSHSGTQHGIYVSNSADNPIIRGNVCWGNSGCGIQINADVSMGGDGIITGALIEKNTCYSNGATGGAGINLDGVQSSTIRNNLLYGNIAGGITLFMGDGAAGPANDLILNNTVLMPSNGRWCLNMSSAGVGNVVKNNIFYQASTSKGSIETDAVYGPGSITSDNNIVVDRMTTNGGGSNLSLATWQSTTGQDAHSILVNSSTIASLFVNMAANDYHLAAGSLAVDAGADLSALNVLQDLEGKPRPSGSGYDIGAYEYQYPALLGGDANGDNKVSFADYLILEQNFGKSGATWAMGDFNNDGKVSFADYLILEQNFGKSAPEPASIGLLALLGLGLSRRRAGTQRL